MASTQSFLRNGTLASATIVTRAARQELSAALHLIALRKSVARTCTHPLDSLSPFARPSGQLRCSRALPAPAVGTFPRKRGKGMMEELLARNL